MPTKDLNSWSHRKLIGLVICLSFIFLMLGNGALSLTHPDEVFYIQSAKEMLQHNDWMTPYIFDAPQFEKPILSYWLFMISIKLFGLNSFAGRFAPALFGILGVLAIYGISWSLFKNKRLSFLSSLILMSTFIHLGLARSVLTDMIFSVWVILSLGAFYWAYDNPKNKSTGIILTFIFSGIAILTKGLLGFCFPAGIILIFLTFRKDFRFLRSLSVLWGFLLMLVIALPWHIYMYKLHGPYFLQGYFQNVHIRRLLEAEHDKSNTWYFYPVTVIGGIMPWTIFLFSALGLFIRGLKERGKGQQSLLFLLAWMIGIFIFVQPASSKLASYIVPIFPAVVIILAYYLEKVILNNKPNLRTGFVISGYVLVGMLVIAVIGIMVASKKFHQYVPSDAPLFLLMGVFASIAFAIFWYLRNQNFRAVLWTIPVISLSMIVIALCAKPYAEPWVSCEQVSENLQKVDRSDSVILTSKFFVRGVKYYTDRKVAVIDINGRPFFSPHPIPFLDSDTKVDAFLKSQPVTFCIVKHSNVRDLKRISQNDHFLLTEMGESGGKFILKIENKNFRAPKK